jgi:RNase P/RNase MRP subunit p30
MILEPKTAEQLRKINPPRIVRAQDIAFNRKIIEKKLVEILVLPSNNSKKDSLKYLDTGLNSIALRAAAKNKVALGIDFEKLREFNKKQLSENLARISQDIKLSRKCKVSLAFSNHKSDIGARAFLRALGASTAQSSRAISF